MARVSVATIPETGTWSRGPLQDRAGRGFLPLATTEAWSGPRCWGPSLWGMSKEGEVLGNRGVSRGSHGNAEPHTPLPSFPGPATSSSASVATPPALLYPPLGLLLPPFITASGDLGCPLSWVPPGGPSWSKGGQKYNFPLPPQPNFLPAKHSKSVLVEKQL